LFVLLTVSCAPAIVTSQPTQAVSTPTTIPTTEVFKPLDLITIPAPSLESNLIDEPTQRDILVYLPPSYGIPDKHFPVVDYLPGYGDSDMIGFNLPDSMDRLVSGGSLQRLSSKCAWRTYSRLHAAIFLNHIEI
jgi:hypothetical protein